MDFGNIFFFCLLKVDLSSALCVGYHTSAAKFTMSIFMSETGAWRQLLAWHVQINVFSAGGITQIQ